MIHLPSGVSRDLAAEQWRPTSHFARVLRFVAKRWKRKRPTNSKWSRVGVMCVANHILETTEHRRLW
jgi:hypothetical protein